MKRWVVLGWLLCSVASAAWKDRACELLVALQGVRETRTGKVFRGRSGREIRDHYGGRARLKDLPVLLFAAQFEGTQVRRPPVERDVEAGAYCAELRTQEGRVVSKLDPILVGTEIEWLSVLHEQEHWILHHQLPDLDPFYEDAMENWETMRREEQNFVATVLVGEESIAMAVEWELLRLLDDGLLAALVRRVDRSKIAPFFADSLHRRLGNARLPLRHFIEAEWKAHRYDLSGAYAYLQTTARERKAEKK